MLERLFPILLILPNCICCIVASADDVEFFEKHIRPVLVQNCYECHSVASEEPGGGLLLDSRPTSRKGGDSGPAVVPFQVDQSLLVSAIKHKSFEMPPKKKLDQATIDAFVTWIQRGAVDPRDEPLDGDAVAKEIWEQTYQSRKQWWSFQPLSAVDPPDVQVDSAANPGPAKSWSASPIDRFLLKSLQEHSLQPAGRAEREVLIRRLAFTLTGLPPSLEDVRAFVVDDRPDAWDQLVDHYLNSQHFGERFARHWMDVVRYADTYGYEWDVPAKGAWRYRDYLIRAFNDDVPFDQMIREQLAGDLLLSPRINHELQLNESALGPMFYQLGEHRHGDSLEFEGIHQEMIDNKIDAFSKAFQGITIACARCHDHKLDPISQQEYYALAGVFMSSRWASSTVDLPSRHATTMSELESLKSKLRDAVTRVWINDLQQNINPESLDAIQPATQLPVGDINHPWNTIYKLHGNALSTRWMKLEQEIAKADEEAEKFNSATFTLLADFSTSIPDGWQIDGVGLDHVASGDFSMRPGDNFIESLFLPGLATSRLSSRLNGALRSPLLADQQYPFFAMWSAGNDLSAFRRVIDNAFLCEKQTYYANSHYHWKVESTFPGQQDRRIYFEFATKTSNPNFPPRWGLGTKLTEEMIDDPHSWFAVSRIYGSHSAATPKQRLTPFLQLLRSGVPASKTDAAELMQRWLVEMVQRWSIGTASAEEIQVLNNLLQTPWVTRSASHPQLKSLVSAYREVESRLSPPRTVNSMSDQGEGMNYRLNVRGSYYDLGNAVPRGYLRLLTRNSDTSAAFTSTQSGRMELAHRVADGRNPLTARVYVNRVWLWMFGKALVDTPDNFGKLGAKPSHPQLLDFLAKRFIDDGWSTKKLIRDILLTQAWQQAGTGSTAGFDADPNNRLLHHFSTRRLEAECIGDAMLVLSGGFNSRLFGPSHDPFRTSEDPMKRLFSGPLDGHGRRMLYTKVTIMEPARFLATFNQPEPKIPTGKRDITNTPTQALTLLNHPFVMDAAAHWGNQVIQDGNTNPEIRLETMLSRAFSRRIQEPELTDWKQTLEQLAALRTVPKGGIMDSADLWADIAHTIFNCTEFIYVK